MYRITSHCRENTGLVQVQDERYVGSIWFPFYMSPPPRSLHNSISCDNISTHHFLGASPDACVYDLSNALELQRSRHNPYVRTYAATNIMLERELDG